MARPLRIEFAGALYHITSRGNARENIYRDNLDRDSFLELLYQTNMRHGWICHAYCLMSNHYHLLIETSKPTLSKGMKHLNGSYTQRYNRRHQRIGHVFQGRYKSILIEKESYLRELSRYIVLNPVRARMVRKVVDWPWAAIEPPPAIQALTIVYQRIGYCLVLENTKKRLVKDIELLFSKG